jgi:anti-sigma factor RsiW
MRCDDLNRWFDDGMPAEGEADARRHAATCPACARSLASFAALEASLSGPAPAPPRPAAFTAGVLARVAVAPPVAGRRWWIQLLSEPAFTVAVTAGVALILTPVAIRFEASQSIALAASVAFQSLVGAASGALAALAPREALSPLGRFYLSLGLAPLLAALGFWLIASVESALRGAPRRRG